MFQENNYMLGRVIPTIDMGDLDCSKCDITPQLQPQSLNAGSKAADLKTMSLFQPTSKEREPGHTEENI